MNSNSAQQLCRLCLESCADLVNICENFKDSTIAAVLAEHFWFQDDKKDGVPEWVCELCWNQTKTFHLFFKRVESRHQNNWSSVNLASAVEIKLESLEADLNIVKCEEETDDNHTITEEEGFDDDNNGSSCDENETRPTFDDEDHRSIQKLRNENVIGKTLKRHNPSEVDRQDDQIRQFLNMRCELCSDVELDTLENMRNHYRQVHKMQDDGDQSGLDKPKNEGVADELNRESLLEKERQDAEIRRFFRMKCEICSDVEFDTLKQVTKHYRNIHKTRGYLICCGTKYNSRWLMLDHIQYHVNPSDAHRCDQCGKSCRDRQILRAHVKTHERGSDHKCSLCSKTYSSAALLKYHVRDKHSTDTSEKFPCSHCGKICPTKLSLTRHMKNVHDPSMDHVCDICGRAFKEKANMQVHKKMEHSITPLPKAQCDICGTWLKHERSLRKHLKMHQEMQDAQGDKVLSCPMCEKKVHTKQALSNHVRFSHGERKHQCTFCDKAFRILKNLQEHIATHTGADLYSCSYCDRTFKSNANMFNHRKKVHLAEWTRDKLEKNKQAGATETHTAKTSDGDA